MENKHHAYPSTGQFKNVIKEITTSFRKNQIFDFPTLTFIGTVKLHGTNASIYSDFQYNNIIFQSKNNVITPEKDNCGFATEMQPNTDLFLKIFNDIKEKISDHENKTAVIYGEWCGENIQQSVALAELPKMFVIFGIKITNSKTEESWLSHDNIQSVLSKHIKELNDNKIYCIYDFPTWKINIDFNQPQLVQNELVAITSEVERECPVSKQLGVIGIGEGVVWRNSTPHAALDGLNLFFKVKGKEHSVSNVTSLAMVDTEKVKNIAEFVDKVVTDNRLKQGLEYLTEQQLEHSNENMKIFISWVVKDCFKEEKDMITESNLKEKDVSQSIAFKARDWFLNKNQSNKKMKL